MTHETQQTQTGTCDSQNRLPAVNAASPSSRRWVQLGFIICSALTGLQFHRFLASLTHPAARAVPRPDEVDAWLPISSFMSLVYLVKTGIANTVHPAGLVLFTLILLLSAVMRRGFCSWVCPVGTLSEYAHRIGRRTLGRNLRMPKPLDVLLRAVKYLLLAFFVTVIVRMSARDLQAFIQGSYNRLADVRMYQFFCHLSPVAVAVIAALVILSLLFKNFWCRYLCPYGALLGLVSLASPLAVRRDEASCSGCGRCTEACPNRISVHTLTSVRTPECTACYSCVKACRQPSSLRMGPALRKKSVTPILYGIILIAAFVFLPKIFRAVGYWNSDTSPETYRRLLENNCANGHPRTAGPLSGPQ